MTDQYMITAAIIIGIIIFGQVGLRAYHRFWWLPRRVREIQTEHPKPHGEDGPSYLILSVDDDPISDEVIEPLDLPPIQPEPEPEPEPEKHTATQGSISDYDFKHKRRQWLERPEIQEDWRSYEHE